MCAVGRRKAMTERRDAAGKHRRGSGLRFPVRHAAGYCTDVHAEGVGFEPTDGTGPSPVFKTGALNRSAIPPGRRRPFYRRGRHLHILCGKEGVRVGMAEASTRHHTPAPIPRQNRPSVEDGGFHRAARVADFSTDALGYVRHGKPTSTTPPTVGRNDDHQVGAGAVRGARASADLVKPVNRRDRLICYSRFHPQSRTGRLPKTRRPLAQRNAVFAFGRDSPLTPDS